MVRKLRSYRSVRCAALLTVTGVALAACATAQDSAGPSTSAAPSSSAAAGEPQPPSRPAPPGGPDDPVATDRARELSNEVHVDGAMAHLRAFQDIANANGGNRSLATPGYLASVDYVESTLRDAGYDVQRQRFEVSSWSATQQEATTGGAPLTVTALTGSGGTNGVLTGTVVSTDNLGCSDADVAAVTAGSIAVVQRGTCTFGEKYQRAAARGASALIVVNTEDGELSGATLGLDTQATIPVVGVAPSDAARLTTGSDVTLTVAADTTQQETWNVIAETAGGDPSNVAVVGAHLDGVLDGPGINDNATGVAAVLEAARALRADAAVKNKVRFAFWGAEEQGLLGAEHYVTELTPDDRARISRYLNFDMLASPNGALFTYDGDGSDNLAGSVAAPSGSDTIEEVFRRFAAARELPMGASAFDGRSDYGPFIAAGIPAGGVDTGADGTKTDQQQQQWGGTAGEDYDPNYHTPADSLDNVNLTVYGPAVGAVAWATGYFAAL